MEPNIETLLQGKKLWGLSNTNNDARVSRLLREDVFVDFKGSGGWTPLHRACAYNKPAIVKLLLEHNANPNEQDEGGNTPLHVACWRESINCIDLLLATEKCDLDITNKDNLTPMGLVIQDGILLIVKYLTTKCNVDNEVPVTKTGESPLMLAVHAEKWEIVKYFMMELNFKLPDLKLLMTVLERAALNCELALIKYLVTNEQDANVKDLDSTLLKQILERAIQFEDLPFVKFVCEQRKDIIQGDSDLVRKVLTLTFEHEDVDFIKFLSRANVAINEKHLQMACKFGYSKVVHYLLTDLRISFKTISDNGETLLTLAKNKDVIKLLLQHGAVAEDAYKYHRKALGNVFSKDPLKSVVKMFVIGNGGEGKSTLIEAMEHEPTQFEPLVTRLVNAREVDGVSQKTAGIIPRVFKSRFYGDVIFYDFAGQEAYYSSHAAVIRSAVDTCPPIFILVIGLHRNDTLITDSALYWLRIIVNQCASMEGKAPLIVVGSHQDLIKANEIEGKRQLIVKAVERYPSFELVDIIPMDCRFSNSEGMKVMRHCVGNSCEAMRSKLSVSLNSHMFLIYLIKEYSGEYTVSLEQVQTRLEQEPSKKNKKLLSFIPKTLPHLIDICIQLSDKGHIIFLLNKSAQEKSFIIIDKVALLAEINGTMFAPADFRQHCKLATSTGAVPRSKLAKQFQKFDIDMLTGFLSHLELAVPIEDKEVIDLINKYLTKETESDVATAADFEEGYLFCPALIRLDVSPDVHLHENDYHYHFGWILSCVQVDHFFDARFLHVLILRLALSLSLSPVVDPDIPAFQRHCSVWKTGVCWSTPGGVKVMVEVITKKKVLLLIHANILSSEFFVLRSTIINKVLQAASEFCPSVKTAETLLSPSDSCVLDSPGTKLEYSFKSVAQTIIKRNQFVVSTTGTYSLPMSDLLPEEVYTNVGEAALQMLFNKSDQELDKKISDQFISSLCSVWSNNPKLVEVLYSIITKQIEGLFPSSGNKLDIILKSWRDISKGSYRCLRQLLDPLSVFAGKNVLELANFHHSDSDNKSSVHHFDAGAAHLQLSYYRNRVGEVRQQQMSIEELKRKTRITDSQLDTQLIEFDLQNIANYFDNVDAYLYKLGLTEGQQTDIKHLACRRSTNIAMVEALKLWRQPNPYTATFRALLQILLDLKRGDVAVSICHYIIEKI